MKGIAIAAPGRFERLDLEEPPEPGPGEALVRTRCMGICGTDLAGYLGKMPFFSYPRIPGHELGLEVLAVGKDVKNVEPGDRCALEPYVNDPMTRTSRKGASNCCPGVEVLGVHRDGGLRERWLCPAHKLHRGNGLRDEELALVETLAIGRHAVGRAAPGRGDTVVVVGAGPIGLACLEFLRLGGVRQVVMDVAEHRLAFCRGQSGVADAVRVEADGSHLDRLREVTDGEWADVVIDATGSARSMAACFDYAGHTGKVVYVGITSENVVFAPAPVFHRRELTLLASRNALPEDFREIIGLLGRGEIDAERWITHRFGFGEVEEGFAKLVEPGSGAIKAVIEVG